MRSVSTSSKTPKSVSISGTSPSRRNLSRTDIGAAIALAVLIVVSRAPVLLQSVASADEGLYALVARELLHGHLPYTTVWETKPPLLFGLLAAAFAVFGTTPLAMRLATDTAIFATALALFAIGSQVRRDGRSVGIAAAVLYVALTLSDSASSALAETFYAVFVAFPIAVALRARRRGTDLTLAAALVLGVSLACAVLVKESAALEAAFAGFVILRAVGMRALGPLAVGFVAAIGCSILPYAVAHELGQYWDANYSAVARRAFVAVTDATPLSDVLRAQAFAFFPVTLLAFGIPWFLRRRTSEGDERGLMRLALAWAVLDIVTVIGIREFLGNHFIPLMAPAALAGALVVVAIARGVSGATRARSERDSSDARDARDSLDARGARASLDARGARGPGVARRFLTAVLVIGLLAHCAYQFVLGAPITYARAARHDPNFGDTTAQLAAYLRANAGPGATLYVADDRTMLYVLTGFAPPTRYAYSAHLVDRYQEVVAGVDGRAEVARILAGQPRYVVRDLANRAHEDPRVRDLLDREIAGSYRSAFAVGTHVIYKRSGMK